jgi:hypothetical protein
MTRAFIVAFVLCFSSFASAQTRPRPAATAAAPVTKKPTQKAKLAKPAISTDNGACTLGVISAAGSPIALKKVGITVFGNEYSEIPSDAWGIDDLIVARVRAAAGPGIAVRRIAYGKEALFELYQKPGTGLFNNPRANLTAVVRQIASNSHCGRYIVITRFIGSLAGTNQSLEGVGFVIHGPFGKTAVFANIRVTVFDGQTFAIRDDPFGSLGARLSSALARTIKDDSLRPVEGVEFPVSPEAAARDAKLRDSARTMVAERLDKILPEYLKQ